MTHVVFGTACDAVTGGHMSAYSDNTWGRRASAHGRWAPTLALVFAGEIHGSRGIIKWDVQSPLTYEQAVECMRQMGPHARVMENLDKPNLQ